MADELNKADVKNKRSYYQQLAEQRDPRRLVLGIKEI
jgi:hypothetical protein